MAADLQGLAHILEASLDPSQNKQGSLNAYHKLLFSKLMMVNSGARHLARRGEAKFLAVPTTNSRLKYVR